MTLFVERGGNEFSTKQVVMRDAPDSKSGFVQELLWGDDVEFASGEDDPQPSDESGDWYQVRGRNQVGWVPKAHLTGKQLLSMYMVDVGQGDGAIVLCPNGERLVVDAGKSDNVLRFLGWLYGFDAHKKRKAAEEPEQFDAAIVSHPDADHYAGFGPMLDSGWCEFDRVFHSGLVERKGESLGSVDASTSPTMHTELVDTNAEATALLGRPDIAGNYLKLFEKFRTAGSTFSGVSTRDPHLPGFTPKAGFAIEVVGPRPVKRANRWGLPRFENDHGKTKNGHSVVLRFVYKNVSVLLGGDLNEASQRWLLDETPGDAGTWLRSDVAKACHHGSSDFADEFLQKTDAAATLVSSGDNESFSHPRADAMGAYGRYGRGDRPLLFSTELARSYKENLDRKALVKALTERTPQDFDRAWRRLVAVYGMVNVRTDGERVMIAIKLESKARNKEFDRYWLLPGQDGLVYDPAAS
jgi:hypothetical protein